MNLNIGYVGCAHTCTLKCCKQGENEVFMKLPCLFEIEVCILELTKLTRVHHS